MGIKSINGSISLSLSAGNVAPVVQAHDCTSLAPEDSIFSYGGKVFYLASASQGVELWAVPPVGMAFTSAEALLYALPLGESEALRRHIATAQPWAVKVYDAMIDRHRGRSLSAVEYLHRSESLWQVHNFWLSADDVKELTGKDLNRSGIFLPSLRVRLRNHVGKGYPLATLRALKKAVDAALL